MKVPMGPPPPKTRNPNPNPNPTSIPDPEPSTAIQSVDGEEKDTTIPTQSVAGEEKTTTTDTQNIAGEENLTDQDEAQAEEKISNPSPNHAPLKPQHAGISIPYSIPPWSQPPSHPFFFEVLKDGAIIEKLDVSEKGAYMFGRVDLCDFVLEHPTISRFHAVLQFKKHEVFLYDLGSTHGTSINKRQAKSKNYTEVHVGDVIRFGQSSRLYVFQGPSELMPPEAELEKIRKAKMLREEMNDRIASLARAKVEASLADGISWGMDEDAPEEAPEDDADEVTWQTYRGELTERQEKTRGKILKRMEKVANMKKEIDAIRVKDISQGGLTQGQQTQIARNEQRMTQIMEELESLEETLNESIQESIGARSGKVVLGKKKGYVEEEDDILSDEDDFFDRTKKQPSAKKYGKQQAVETADSLLDKKELIVNEMEEKKALLIKEKDKLGTTSESSSEGGDDLDSYMTALSSQLVVDKTVKIQKELSELQSELDRILYLLKIADPMGDASKRREVKVQTPKPSQPLLDMRKQPQSKQKKPAQDEKSVKSTPLECTPSSAQDEKPVNPEEVEVGSESKENKPVTYTVTKPQWLGAKMDMKLEDDQAQGVKVDVTESNKDEFVDYKDRKKVLASVDNGQELENAAPGLIIRKRKSEDRAGEKTVDKAAKLVATSSSSPVEAEATAADAVALLLKHKRGYVAFDDEIKDESQEKTHTKSVSGKASSQPKRVFGPPRPDFLEKGPDYESWVPPEGQTGDGRTSLNDRLGY